MRIRKALMSIVVACLGTLAVMTTTAAASPTPHDTRTKDLAAEVCEDMVRDAAVAAAGEPLAQPQVGTWRRSKYTCRYPFSDGELRLRVAVLQNPSAAKSTFRAVKARSAVAKRLYGIGQQAFQAEDGAIVARKDNFVLTVAPSGLPRRLNRDSITWSSTLAVFDCW